MSENENNKPVDLGDIPGVKEVYINPVTKPAENKENNILSESMNRFIKETMNGGMINRIIERFDLQGIDIENEHELILKKESKLSASKRKAVEALYNIRVQQRDLMKEIGKDLMGKENPTDEDLRNLLDSVEDANTNQNEVVKAVVNDITQKALAVKIADNKESAEATIKEAEVDYKAKADPEDLTSEAMQNALKQFGRTQFLGSFNSLDLVPTPKVGDIARTIVFNNDGTHSGQELVYVYESPNHWMLVGSVSVPKPETNVEHEKDGSIPLTIEQ